ncbi:MAG: hypothetical protein J7642_21240 [Cyanobacteria bacterium SBC]|nr:hypothetical protein [Cyanobacteria bacterium SBC]
MTTSHKSRGVVKVPLKKDPPKSNATAKPKVPLSSGSGNTLAKFFTGAAFFLVVVLCIGFCFVNVLPYLRVAQRVWETATAGIGSGAFWQQAIVAGFLSLLSGVVSGLLGFVLWAVLQLLELLPVFLSQSRKAMRSMLAEYSKAERYSSSDSDDEDVTTLKLWLNRLAMLPVRRAKQLRVLAYASDLAICLYVYPVDLFAPDLWNVATIVLTLFVVEVCLKAAFATHAIYKHYR